MEFENDGYASFNGINYPNILDSDADVILVGIPYESGTSGKKGTSFGPNRLRVLSRDFQTISRRQFTLENFALKDKGNVPVYPQDERKNYESILTYMKLIFGNSFTPVITIGGDHSITYPELVALSEHGKIGVVWIDAHRDLLDTLNGSKYSHGCSLRRSIESQAVQPEDVLIIGTRYMEGSESKFLAENSIKEIPMAMIEESPSPRKLIKEKIGQLATNVDNLFLSIDIDAVDPAYAPGTGTPVAAGLSSNLLFNIIHDFPKPFRAADIVEVSPPLDTAADITTKLLMGLITELCAKINGWKITC